MLVAVTNCYDNHEPYIAYVDTTKLDPTKYVDKCLLKAVTSKKQTLVIDASDWQNKPAQFPTDNDIDISPKAIVKKRPNQLDAAIILYTSFG